MSQQDTPPPSTRLQRVVAWIDYRLPVFSFLKAEAVDYPTPRNLNYWWNFGSLAGITLVVMIITGIWLAMHYTPDTELAFESVERIMREVNYGWLLRYVHMNGASMFFIVVYIHMFRGLYYGSYKSPRELLWILGVIIFLLIMATAFMGYVLPWGQMSLWGATVITQLFSAIPFVGDDIVTLLLGGFSVGDPTLKRFFVLHYLCPFLVVAFVFFHLVTLHRDQTIRGVDAKKPDAKNPSHILYEQRLTCSIVAIWFHLGVFCFFCAKTFVQEPDIAIEAYLLLTREYVPGWYFLHSMQ